MRKKQGGFFIAEIMTTTDLKTGVVGELGVKAPARVATMTNITLEGLQTVNGIALQENDIVLVNGQTDKTENGVYIASTSAWSRAVWFDDELDAVPGTLVQSFSGTQRSKTLWVTLCDDNPIQFGTSEIEFEYFQTAGLTALLASNNLSDVEDIADSRANLGINFGTSLGDVPQIGTSSVTELLAGLAEIATQAETNAGSDDSKMVSPLKLASRLATEILAGLAEIATSAETSAGTDDSRIVTPAKLAGLFNTSLRSANGYLRIPIKVGGAFVELIAQWGTGSATPGAGSSNVSASISFPLTFPNSCFFNPVISPNTNVDGSTGTGAIIPVIKGASKTNSGFTFTANPYGGPTFSGAALLFSYIVIGF